MKRVTDLEGVYASGCHCGIKPEKKDLAFLFVPGAVGSAGVFTQNKFRAPCLDYTARCLSRGTLKGVVINSGNANAATGAEGFENARVTAERAAAKLGVSPEEIGTASTGIIGVQLPMDRVTRGLDELLADPRARQADRAAEAILTLDTRTKEIYLEATIQGRTVAVGGFAKGAGMIAPNMGTMLAFLVTDAAIDSASLSRHLTKAVDDSFNMVSVDTDTSTNDMVLLFSTGEVALDLSDAHAEAQFRELLTAACTELAKMIAGDGEGAERRIDVRVEGAASVSDARQIAKSVVGSPLVKTAIHGADPNWGRVIMAVGKVPEVAVNPETIDLFLCGTQILSAGKAVPFSRETVVEALRKEVVEIRIDLHLGDGSATAWGCDLTKQYIEINADYN